MSDPRSLGTIVSVDYETDGPNIMQNSLRSIGAVAYLPNGEIREFYSNVMPQPGKQPDASTMRNFWEKPENQSAWAALSDPQPVALQDAWDAYGQWLKAIPGKKIMAAYPLGFEKTVTDFIYMQHGISPDAHPFGINGIDIRSYAAAVLGVSYLEAGKENWPLEWKKDAPPHTHQALDDAKSQGAMLMKMIAFRKHCNLTPQSPFHNKR
jgi:hypothetical protein